jgi:hypothetical protein
VNQLKKLSYLVPYGAIGAVGYFTSVSWWALAMLCGGILFVWEWLWGNTSLLDGRFGLQMVALGLICVVLSYFLANGLGISLSEFQSLSEYLPRRRRLLYRLPAVGIGMTLFGLLIWSGALPARRS